jgi:hypothetical protein
LEAEKPELASQKKMTNTPRANFTVLFNGNYIIIKMRLFQNFSFGETSPSRPATSKKRSFMTLAYGF